MWPAMDKLTTRGRIVWEYEFSGVEWRLEWTGMDYWTGVEHWTENCSHRQD